MSRSSLCALATALLVFAGSGVVNAVEMVPGTFGNAPETFFAKPSASLHSRLVIPSRVPATSFDGFTPRSSGGPVWEWRTRSESSGLSLGVDSAWLERLLRPVSASRTDGLYGTESMLVGGALQLEDVAVMGGLGRTQLFGTTADMITAGLTYGRVRARIAYGQSSTRTDPTTVRDVMMFSTDLAAWSWLTFEGDLAIGESSVEGDQAIGRLGVKLQF